MWHVWWTSVLWLSQMIKKGGNNFHPVLLDPPLKRPLLIGWKSFDIYRKCPDTWSAPGIIMNSSYPNDINYEFVVSLTLPWWLPHWWRKVQAALDWKIDREPFTWSSRKLSWVYSVDLDLNLESFFLLLCGVLEKIKMMIYWIVYNKSLFLLLNVFYSVT